MIASDKYLNKMSFEIIVLYHYINSRFSILMQNCYFVPNTLIGYFESAVTRLLKMETIYSVRKVKAS